MKSALFSYLLPNLLICISDTFSENNPSAKNQMQRKIYLTIAKIILLLRYPGQFFPRRFPAARTQHSLWENVDETRLLPLLLLHH